MALRYSSFLDSFVDWTNDEIQAGKKFLKWEELTINWEKVDLLWEEVFILLEVERVIKGGGGFGYKDYVDNNPWKQLDKDIGKEKTKKVIKLFCRVNDIEFDETRDIDDENQIKVTVNEFERFVQEAISVKIGV